jgi:hypothetical protein
VAEGDGREEKFDEVTPRRADGVEYMLFFNDLFFFLILYRFQSCLFSAGSLGKIKINGGLWCVCCFAFRLSLEESAPIHLKNCMELFKEVTDLNITNINRTVVDANFTKYYRTSVLYFCIFLPHILQIYLRYHSYFLAISISLYCTHLVKQTIE